MCECARAPAGLADHPPALFSATSALLDQAGARGKARMSNRQVSRRTSQGCLDRAGRIMVSYNVQHRRSTAAWHNSFTAITPCYVMVLGYGQQHIKIMSINRTTPRQGHADAHTSSNACSARPYHLHRLGGRQAIPPQALTKEASSLVPPPSPSLSPSIALSPSCRPPC